MPEKTCILYPSFDLAGDDIPVASRIVGAVDAYSAMISIRSYKQAYSEEYARGELRRCAGTQFDPQVVDALIAVLEAGEDEVNVLEDDHDWAVLPLSAG